MTHEIVVLGAGYAGLVAAKRTAARLRSADVHITLVNAVDHFVERVRLHQLAAGQRLTNLPLANLLTNTGIDLMVARAIGIDLHERRVRLDTAPYDLAYDTLVYALGSGPDVSTPGVREHAYTLADTASALHLDAHLRSLKPSSAVAVVGGGLTGIETAAELAAAHPSLRVTLLTSSAVGGWLSAKARGHLRTGLRRLGVETREDARVLEVTEGGFLFDGAGGERELATHAVVWTAGFAVPNLARAAGLAVDERGRMEVDAFLRSVSHRDVYGIGDAAAARAPSGKSRMSCQTGLPMGLHAGDVISTLVTGRQPRPARIRHVWQNISLGRHDGVSQFTRADDTVIDGAVLTGRASARFKEAITRGTVFAMRHPGPWRTAGQRSLRHQGDPPPFPRE